MCDALAATRPSECNPYFAHQDMNVCKLKRMIIEKIYIVWFFYSTFVMKPQDEK